MKLCPACKKESWKIIYMGFPMNLCQADFCRCVHGFFSPIMNVIPFNGVVFKYEGSYLKGLIHWFLIESDEK